MTFLIANIRALLFRAVKMNKNYIKNSSSLSSRFVSSCFNWPFRRLCQQVLRVRAAKVAFEWRSNLPLSPRSALFAFLSHWLSGSGQALSAPKRGTRSSCTNIPAFYGTLHPSHLTFGEETGLKPKPLALPKELCQSRSLVPFAERTSNLPVF